MVRPAPPTISVLIPAYQAEAFVADAIESALAQQPPPLEVLVCDDGSTDGTARVVAAYAPRVRLLTKPNGGEASARNALWRAASGEYVAYLDADDVYLPGRLAAIGALLVDDPTIDVVTTDAYLTLEGAVVGRRYEGEQRFASAEQRRAILRGNFVFGHAVVRRARLERLGGYDEAIRYTTDWEMWIRTILDGGRVALVPEPLAEYRLHAGAMSVERLRMAEGRLMTLEKTLRRDDLSDEERAIVQTSVARERVRHTRERFLADLETCADGTRRHALAVVGAPGQARRTRLLAAIGVVSPRLAARVRGRDGDARRGPGDRPIPRHAGPRSST